MNRIVPLTGALLLGLAACGDQPAAPAAPAASDAPVTQATNGNAVTAVRETDPVDTGEDAADDPAIWANPADPAQSVILGTAKRSGLYVYGLDGKTIQFLPEGRLNNVDIRSVRLGGSMDKTVLVAASDRDNKGLAFYKLDPATRQLSAMGRHASTFADPYGLCLYHSLGTDQLYVFMTDKEKGGAQWRVDGAADGTVTVEKVRDLPLATQSEGCVADDQTATVYVAEENVGIWAFPAEPDQPATATAVAMLSQRPEMAADIEGLAIYRSGQDGGYLIASSQGNNSFALFDLGNAYAYKGSFTIAKGAVDGVSETDGIEVTSAGLGADFPHGLFVAQDGANTDPDANQNFKLVSWDAIAKALKLK
jgi:3-phytase